MTTSTSTKQARLTAGQVAAFRREGYLLFREPVFSAPEFAALRSHFEEKLELLPPNVRPESMDVPHFTDLKLFRWLFADAVLDVVEPLLGPDIALFSSHFICKPRGNGKRVPWHEDSAYWKTMFEKPEAIQIVTVWLAIDPATPQNGCMYVIPRTHVTGRMGYSDYEAVDTATNVFHIEIPAGQRDDSRAVACELQPNQASLHDARLMHGSPPNTSAIRRCGYTMRYMATTTKLTAMAHQYHQVYLARGVDRAGNAYADPTKSYPEKARYRELHGKGGH